MQLRSRRAVSGFWAAVLLGSLSAEGLAQNAIVINEIHYNPDVKTEPAEFVELYNNGTNTVNMAGWAFTGGLDYTFPATNIAPGGYLVIAQNPAFLATKYGFAAGIGPFETNRASRLSANGDSIVLRNADGDKVDEVNYGAGFPWPTVGDPPGYSIELINPNLDNDLGGSWRASVNATSGPPNVTLISRGSSWSYRKGTSEPSTPMGAWHDSAFDDSSWSVGNTPIGYDPSVVMNTPLNDMSGLYSTFYIRKKFVVNDPAIITSLTLGAMYDDGFKVWINGSNVLNASMLAGEVPHDGIATGTARESNNYDVFAINNPQSFLLVGTNVIAVQVANILLSGSSDAFIDLSLSAGTGDVGRGPTPGRRNSVYSTNAPPQIRQVEHSPEQPKAGETVKITAKVTDPQGVASVVLQYQLVDPGNYIELTDAAYTNNWVAVPMNDSGTNGDVLAGDNVFSVDLPGSLQTHRRLVRYRITVTDQLGAWVRVPYQDDPQPNFAYFVYNGTPSWSGAIQPGGAGSLGTVFTVNSNEMGRLATYHLIAKTNSVMQATWINRYGGESYLWGGTLVYDGKVYDHIHYRMRGGVWRYSMCKNMWKFDFNRGHDFEARDDWGRKFSAPWTKLNLGACIQQGDYNHRGEQGMFESVGSRLFLLAGVNAFKTAFCTFRIVDDAQESVSGNQYEGDFWGIYLAVEQENGRFLDEHGLPDSNFYKMEGGTGELNNLGPNGPTDKSDLNYILNNYTGATDQWWRTNWNLPQYYSYQAIVQGIHHFDIAYDKNYFYYYNPVTHLWELTPWDLDLTWAHNMYDPGDAGVDRLAERILNPIKEAGAGAQSGTSVIRLSGTRPVFDTEFRNRVREVRDLLFNTEQAWNLIDEQARLVHGTNANSIIDADRCQWDYNPKMASGTFSDSLGKAGQGRYYQFPLESATNATLKGSFDATVLLMKNYVRIRMQLLDSIAADMGIPNIPVITSTGPSNYPLNRLTFRCSNYSSPSNNAFASMRWRLGEVSDFSNPTYSIDDPWKYEIQPGWDSGPISVFAPDVTIPPDAVRPGHRYRVRAQFTDATGRNSNWSAPIEFTCGAQENLADLMNYLRITELMYNPPPGGYEYVELHNISTTATLDLGGVKFTDGIDFTFPTGTLLAPNAYLVLIPTTDVAAFRAFYGLSENVPLIWAYSKNFDNGGEQVTLKTSAGGSNIVSFTYGDGRGWPQPADGSGHSLVLADSAVPAEGDGSADYAGNWRASTYLKGSPGRGDPVPPVPDLLLNEVAANTESTNDLGSNDWIELYNPNDWPVTAGTNWYLSDDGANLKKWMVPSNTVVPAHGWVSFDEESGFHYPTNTGFGLSKGGEQVFLSYLPGTSEDRVVDSVTFKAQELGWTLGRYPDGGPDWYALDVPTRDTANAEPPLHAVISEVMYHPPDIAGQDDTLDEFVEIYNPTDSPIAFFNTNGPWRLNGGISMSFPSNFVLEAGEYVLAVNFHPQTNLTALATFQALYGITNTNLVLIGPYRGKLGNSSDRVALEKPLAADLPGAVNWAVVDEVIYSDQTPWPCGTDGTGTSLQRVDARLQGNNPLNWSSQTPTPGLPRVPQPAGAPTIVAQPVSRMAALNGSTWFSVGICGTPPFNYQWLFNGNPIPNATNATLVLTNIQTTDGGEYRVSIGNAGGTAVSSPALLTIGHAPTITLQPVSQIAGLGGTATFTVAGEGTEPIRCQWQYEGRNVSGATNTTLVLTNLQRSQEGNYTAVLMNDVGACTSSNAYLTMLVPISFLLQPQSQTVYATNSAYYGQTFTNAIFYTALDGTAPIACQWQHNGADIPGATNTILIVSNVTVQDDGFYTLRASNMVGTATSDTVQLAVVAYPEMTLHLQDATLVIGSTVTFTAGARGSPMPLNYKWKRDATILTNMLVSEPTCSLTIPNAQMSNASQYQVVVNSTVDPHLTMSTNYLTVVIPPTNQYVMPGASTTLSVIAGAGRWTSRITYQWQFKGMNIAGATSSNLVLNNFQASQQGLYTICITNPAKSLTTTFSAQVTMGANPNTDTDGDGMPDWWENAYSFNPNEPSDASQDADGDGMTNLQEYLAGTNPRDAASNLKMRIQTGAAVALEFDAVSNKTYQVEYTENPGTNWTSLTNFPAPGTNGPVQLNDAPGTPKRFYRVRTP